MFRALTAASWGPGRLVTNLRSGLSKAGSGTETRFMIAFFSLFAYGFVAEP